MTWFGFWIAASLGSGEKVQQFIFLCMIQIERGADIHSWRRRKIIMTKDDTEGRGNDVKKYFWD